jgi:hypothetical protein
MRTMALSDSVYWDGDFGFALLQYTPGGLHEKGMRALGDMYGSDIYTRDNPA